VAGITGILITSIPLMEGNYMLDFQLFRLKVHLPNQIDIFGKPQPPSEILKEIIYSHPSAELRKGMIWHIGNVIALDENGYYFRIGKTTTLTIEVYQNGNFLDQEFETAPYTHLILDSRLEICAIAKKPRLSQKISGISNQFRKLLDESEKGKYFRGSFEIDAIKDPEDFISHLQRAYAISKFWITFSKPNPFDVNADFLKPMARLLNESNGEKGKTELEGENLSADKLETLTRSAASTGDDAGALMIVDQTNMRMRKTLKTNPLILKHEDLSDENQKRDLLHKIREIYHRIRGEVDNN
jgi:hypothetical protein